VLARFIPIVRTFAPFVAGVGKMQYRRFWMFNFTGGLAWVLLFLVGGFLFGNLEWVKHQFHLVIFAIIFLSVLPIGIEWFNARRRRSPRCLRPRIPGRTSWLPQNPSKHQPPQRGRQHGPPKHHLLRWPVLF